MLKLEEMREIAGERTFRVRWEESGQSYLPLLTQCSTSYAGMMLLWAL